MSRHITIVSKRIWINFYGIKDPGYIAIGFQHRIAWPPADNQSCHHLLMFTEKFIPRYQKELV